MLVEQMRLIVKSQQNIKLKINATFAALFISYEISHTSKLSNTFK